MRVLTVFVVVQLMLCAIASGKDRVVPVGGKKISVAVPAGYSFETKRDAEGNMAVTMENPVWVISVSAIIVAERDPQITNSEWQRETLVTQLASVLPQSKEADYQFKSLSPKTGTGTYCIFTDSTLKPGQPLPPNEYIHMTGGIKAWPGCFVFFRIMSNDVRSEEYREVFELFRSSFSET